MPVYRYKGRKETGEIVEGTLEAPDEGNLIEKLSQSGVFVSSISQEQAQPNPQEDVFVRFQKVSKIDISQFAKQLATMLQSGLTVLQTFDILIEQSENKKLQQVLIQIRGDMAGGLSLSDALRKQPQIFSPLFVNTLRVGEESGQLEEVLNQLAHFLEKEVDLKAQIKSGTMYPLVLVLTGVSVIIFLVTFVFPKFAYVFTKANVQLPAPTKLLLQFSHLLRSEWYFIIGGIIIFITCAVMYISTPSGRMRFDRFKLNLPLFGTLVRKITISRVARSLEILVRSGVNILVSLRIAAESAGNVVFEEAMSKVETGVREGGSITAPLKETGEFPPMTVRMIGVGEETGRLEEALKNVADDYEKQVDYAIKNLTAIIEPVLVIMMAGAIAFIALSIYLPIFNMMKIME
jgi:type IV pilus assembly protein PilC